MAQKRKNWTRDELLVALNLYCRTRFGSIHSKNCDIIELSNSIGRTPSALAMKMLNFASFDPAQVDRGVTSLQNTSNLDRATWDQFKADSESLAYESELAMGRLGIRENMEAGTLSMDVHSIEIPSSKTESIRQTRMRLVQNFFRSSVLAIYQFNCAICSIKLIELLNASHIIPWRESVERRADPTNGLALCVIHDRAFDRGLITLDEEFRVVLSDEARIETTNPMHLITLHKTEGRTINMPLRFLPDQKALDFHRRKIFRK